jgi:hypothetical protein
MDRRDFIRRSTGLAAAAAAPTLCAQAFPALTQWPVPVRPYRFDAGSAAFLAVDDASIDAGTASRCTPVRLSLEGFHPAADGDGCGLDALDIHALFSGAGGERWRFIVWRYRHEDRYGSSRATGFELAAGTQCRLEFSLRGRDDRGWCNHGLVLDSAAWLPGRYLVALATGAQTRERTLPFSGDWARPVAPGVVGDWLAMRLEPTAPAVDLSQRADLACLHAGEPLAPAAA